MAAFVKSTDPRKPAVVAALKRITGATRITSVKEISDGQGFIGTCLMRSGLSSRRYIPLGAFIVSLDEVVGELE